MTSDEEIVNLEQAKRYFISMGCSHFHIARENFQRAKEYRSFKIKSEIESEWIKEEFESKLENFYKISPNDFGWFLRSLDSMIEQKEFYLEKILELVLKIQESLPLGQIEYVLSTIIGNNGTKTKGGLIQKSYDLKRVDLANDFYIQTKILLKKAEENLITITSSRGYLIDVIEYYEIEEDKDFLVNLRNKHHIENFKYFKESAEEGNKYAMKMLSVYYQEGNGCKTDIDKAKYWAQKAKE